jgi:tape measure domain-containing protein
MTDMARISIGVDDKGVTLMTKVLPQLTAETAKAEAAAKKLGAASDKGSRSVSAFGTYVAATGQRAERAARSVQAATASVQKMESAASKASNTIRNLAGALGIGLTIREVVNLSDAYTTMTARLRLVTESEQQRLTVQRSLNNVAGRTRTDIAATTDLFVKLRQANEGLGYTTGQTTDLTEAFGLALKVSGASGAAATSAIQQFSQAMSKGALTGDEFVTISEAAPEVLRILQQETGKSRAQLLEMREAGELTSKMIADSLLKNLERLRGQIGTAPVTIADGFVALRNSMIKTIGASNDMATAAKNIAEGLAQTGKFLEDNGPILLQLGKLAVGAYAGVKAVNALRAALVAVNGVSLASIVGRLGPLAALLAPFAGFAAKGLRDASDAKDRAADVDRLAALPASERDTLAAGTVASLTAVDRRRIEVAKLRQTENSEALAREEQLLNIRRNELVELQKRIRDAGGFAAAVAETATEPPTGTGGKTAAQIAKEARERMLDALEAAGKEITDGIARRSFNADVTLRGALRGGPLLGFGGDDSKTSSSILIERTVSENAARSSAVLLEQAEERAVEATKRAEQLMQSLANGLQNTFASGIEGLFTRGTKSVKDFAENLRNTLLRAFSEVLAAEVTGRLLRTLSTLGRSGGGGGGGTAGSVASSLGGIGTAGAKAGAGGLLGLGLAAIAAPIAAGNALGASGRGNAAGATVLGLAFRNPLGALTGFLFGRNSRKKKQEDAAKQLAADAASFADDLIIRTLEASGDSFGATKKRLELSQDAERKATAARFGVNSPQYRALLDTQARERAAVTNESGELSSGVYQAPSGFDVNAYRFAAGGSGRQQMVPPPITVTGPVSFVLPNGTTDDMARDVVRRLQTIASTQGVSRWSEVYPQ